jgi:branched-chain amino acid transport system substrate-binding protein
MRTIRATAIAALSAATLLSGAAAPAKADIKIGLGDGITGQIAALGDQAKRGTEQAIKDINAAGGVLGQKLQLQIGDDACDPKQAVSVANQFVSSGVKLIIGHLCSGASIAASDVYAEENIIMITGSATSPQLTERGKKNIFRVCGRDDQQGELAGKLIADKFKDKKIAVINDKQAYGQGLAAAAEKTLKAAGVTPALVTAINAGDRDFGALISRMKDADIGVVYYGGYNQELGLMVRQARERGLQAQFIGADGIASSDYWAITGDAGTGTLFTFSPDAKANPAAAKAVEALRAAGREPDNFALYFYSAVQVMAQAIANAGAPDPTKVESALRSGEFDTIVGKVKFDAKGDLTRPDYVFYEWRDGKYTVAKL